MKFRRPARLNRADEREGDDGLGLALDPCGGHFPQPKTLPERAAHLFGDQDVHAVPPREGFDAASAAGRPGAASALMLARCALDTSARRSGSGASPASARNAGESQIVVIVRCLAPAAPARLLHLLLLAEPSAVALRARFCAGAVGTHELRAVLTAI